MCWLDTRGGENQREISNFLTNDITVGFHHDSCWVLGERELERFLVFEQKSTQGFNSWFSDLLKKKKSNTLQYSVLDLFYNSSVIAKTYPVASYRYSFGAPCDGQSRQATFKSPWTIFSEHPAMVRSCLMTPSMTFLEHPVMAKPHFHLRNALYWPPLLWL